MKTVIFVRHGKSSWEYDVSDKDRPLKERGVNDAIMVSKEFKKKVDNVDFVYSSPANRALHTSMIFTRILGYDLSKFRVSEALYDFSGNSVLRFLREMDNSLNRVMIFGHNYAFTSLVNTLGDNYIENVPTSGLVQVQFKITDWNSIEKGETNLKIFPKDLK